MIEPKNPDRLSRYLRDMRKLDPGYHLPLIDFWNPEVVDQLENVRRKPGKRKAFDARIGPFAVTYEEGKAIPVKLEIRDAETGRRLRQDGEDDTSILRRIEERINAEED
ncbi:MAG: hypothetical protein OXT73_05860 [Bacteroidota bacterium]|nr:hypothetical protein [Bacteroidota bacterium]